MAGLTVLKVKSAKPGRHVDRDVRGLCLVVSESGARSWVLRIQSNNKRRDLGLGGYPDVQLEAAREKARQLRRIVRAGGDPIAERDKDKVAIPSFTEAAEACHAARATGWSVRTADAFLATLKLHVFPKLGRLRVDSIDENDIVSVLSPLWTVKPAAAGKLKQRIGTVLDFSKGKGWRAVGMPRDGLRPLLDTKKRGGNFAAMPYMKVPAFVESVRGKPATQGRLALLFLIFTAARSGEVRAATWDQIDRDTKNWNRPGEIMKDGKPHTVTLSAPAIAILDEMAKLRTIEVDCLIFEGKGGRPLSDMTL